MLDHLKIVIQLVTFFIEFVKKIEPWKRIGVFETFRGYLEWGFGVEFGDLDFQNSILLAIIFFVFKIFFPSLWVVCFSIFVKGPPWYFFAKGIIRKLKEKNHKGIWNIEKQSFRKIRTCHVWISLSRNSTSKTANTQTK